MTATIPPAPEGLRARKRRETLDKITAAGLRLFIAQGYEATTIDSIAAEAGISRRTFFYYFQSKDDILLASQSGIGSMIAAAMVEAATDGRPFDALRAAVIRISQSYAPRDMLALDRIMRSSPSVQSRKQASYVAHEQTIFAALCDRWPDPDRRDALRHLAMITIGTLRLALETFNREEGARPLADILSAAFDALDREI